MNLCINLDKDDFSLNIFEIEIKKWIGEIEQFYLEIRSLLEKLKKLELKLKNNYNDFELIRNYLVTIFLYQDKD